MAVLRTDIGGWSGSGFSHGFDPDAIEAPRGLPRPTALPRPTMNYQGPGWGGPWSAPPTMRPLTVPHARPFGGDLQRKRRQWGRRFLSVLGAAGPGAHFTRVYGPVFASAEDSARATLHSWTAKPR